MTAVEFIEAGIKARERYWHDQYQQGYQRALSDLSLYIEEAKQMERDRAKEDIKTGYNQGYLDAQCNHVNDADNFAEEQEYARVDPEYMIKWINKHATRPNPNDPDNPID